MQHQDEVLTSDEFGISWLVKPDDLASLVVNSVSEAEPRHLNASLDLCEIATPACCSRPLPFHAIKPLCFCRLTTVALPKSNFESFIFEAPKLQEAIER